MRARDLDETSARRDRLDEMGLLNGAVLPPRFGEGWLSNPAADLVRVAITIGGFPERETVRALALAGKPNRKLNIRTVERVLGEVDESLPGCSRGDR